MFEGEDFLWFSVYPKPVIIAGVVLRLWRSPNYEEAKIPLGDWRVAAERAAPINDRRLYVISTGSPRVPDWSGEISFTVSTATNREMANALLKPR